MSNEIIKKVFLRGNNDINLLENIGSDLVASMSYYWKDFNDKNKRINFYLETKNIFVEINNTGMNGLSISISNKTIFNLNRLIVHKYLNKKGVYHKDIQREKEKFLISHWNNNNPFYYWFHSAQENFSSKIIIDFLISIENVNYKNYVRTLKKTLTQNRKVG
jgi:hypothetical protein